MEDEDVLFSVRKLFEECTLNSVKDFLHSLPPPKFKKEAADLQPIKDNGSNKVGYLIDQSMFNSLDEHYDPPTLKELAIRAAFLRTLPTPKKICFGSQLAFCVGACSSDSSPTVSEQQ